MPPAPRPALRPAIGIAAFWLLAGPALAQEESWTRHLPGIAPGLVACLEGEAGAAATVALPMSGGRLLVRLARPDGEALECVAELGAPGQAAKRESRRAAGPVPPLPGEGETLFTLDRRCAAARPVQEGGAPAQGWLAPAGCR
jgi:hypothetical protein